MSQKVKVKQLDVTITYTVSLCDLELDKKTFKQLKECFENGIEVDPSSISGMQYPDAADFLSTNISDSDSMEWEAEITEIEK